MLRADDPVKTVRPAYLTEADYPWLGRLIEEIKRLEGKRRRVLVQRLAEPMPFVAPRAKLAAAVLYLSSVIEELPVGEPKPAELRAAIFAAAAELRSRHRDIMAPSMLARLSLNAVFAGTALKRPQDCDVKQLVENYLYADIPSERMIAGLPAGLSSASLAVHANSMMVARQLRRAHSVTIELWGESRRVIRQAKLRGLICVVSPTDRGVCLLISGPMAVIRRTTYYGRALAELVPFLVWCAKFRMMATCVGQSDFYHLRIESGDPLLAAPSQPSFDSQLEHQFARAFEKLTSDWDLVREPEPMAVPGRDGKMRLVFPDFAVVQRTNPANRWFIEIVGFWTVSYLAAKLDGLRGVASNKMILCVDERLACESGELGAFPAVVRFKRQVPVAEILRMIDGN